jgi:hypothetical protein
MEFSKTIETVESTYVFAKETFQNVIFSPNQHIGQRLPLWFEG